VIEGVVDLGLRLEMQAGRQSMSWFSLCWVRDWGWMTLDFAFTSPLPPRYSYHMMLGRCWNRDPHGVTIIRQATTWCSKCEDTGRQADKTDSYAGGGN
jgi:hypothetical protein